MVPFLARGVHCASASALACRQPAWWCKCVLRAHQPVAQQLHAVQLHRPIHHQPQRLSDVGDKDGQERRGTWMCACRHCTHAMRTSERQQRRRLSWQSGCCLMRRFRGLVMRVRRVTRQRGSRRTRQQLPAAAAFRSTCPAPPQLQLVPHIDPGQPSSLHVAQRVAERPNHPTGNLSTTPAQPRSARLCRRAWRCTRRQYRSHGGRGRVC